jgi:hypothetical protein
MAAALAAAGAGLADVVLSGGVAGTERQAS